MPHQGEPHPVHKSLFWDGNLWNLKKAARKSERLCQTKFCRNPVFHECRRKKGSDETFMVVNRTCSKCRSKRWRTNNPLRYAYKNLSSSAKKRKIPFTITIEHFRELCDKSDYLTHRGNGADSLHIDRKDPLKGYVPGNLEVLTCSANVAKGNRERRLPSYVRHRKSLTSGERSEALVEEDYPIIDGAECPF